MQTIILNNIEYREVPGYPHYYVSAQGNVYSEHIKGFKKNSMMGIYPYPVCQLMYNGKLCNIPVHKLVALAWCILPKDITYDDVIGNYRNKKIVVDHIDNDKMNYNASNLRWCYQYENTAFRNYKHGQGKKGNNNAKGHKGVKSRHAAYIYHYNNNDYRIKDLCTLLNCSKSAITEAFRHNTGLVRRGLLTRTPTNTRIYKKRKSK